VIVIARLIRCPLSRESARWFIESNLKPLGKPPESQEFGRLVSVIGRGACAKLITAMRPATIPTTTAVREMAGARRFGFDVATFAIGSFQRQIQPATIIPRRKYSAQHAIMLPS
jgi:hypothetical protein